MKQIIIAALLASLAAPALAQQSPPPDDPVQDLGVDWQAYMTAQKHTLEDIQKLAAANQSLKAENDKLKTETAPASAPTPKAIPTP